MGVVWKEEGTKPQVMCIEMIFERYRKRGEASPGVRLFKRDVIGSRLAREPNARAEPIALVCGAPKEDGRRVVELVTPSGQTFPYAPTDTETAELDETERTPA